MQEEVPQNAGHKAGVFRRAIHCVGLAAGCLPVSKDAPCGTEPCLPPYLWQGIQTRN